MHKRSALLIALVLICAIQVFAQTQTGQLTGTVTSGNSPLPGVTVTVSSTTLQGTRTTQTDVNGNYNFGALPPGVYTVSFTMEGMQNVTRTASVTLAGTARADAVLNVSSMTESITITATAPAVVDSSTIQSNVSAETIDNLPMQRTLQSTVALMPGTNANGPGGNINISGAASYDNSWFINGTPVNEVLRGQPLDVYVEDAIQETTVLTGSISAEYGRFTGGVVNAISKSGGNDFTASIRDNLSNPSWAKKSPLNEALLDQTNHTYEGTFGGRIIRDRLWFFTDGRYQDRQQQNFFTQASTSFSTKTEQQRAEGKLTGQITPRNTIMGSLLRLSATITDRCLATTCWDRAALSSQEDQPQNLYNLTYNGIFTNNFLMEAYWSKSNLIFRGSGGPSGDILSATPNYDVSTGGTASGSSLFCSTCGSEVREAKNYAIKPRYYLSTRATGTHSFVAGYENYADNRFVNNHQSGSDFTIYNLVSPTRDANGVVLDRATPFRTLIVWWPILENAKTTDLATKAAFINDTWDLGNKWSFNLGARYDRNDGRDQSGHLIANDSKFSPRLAATYDLFGNGRLKINASYAEYVSKIQSGNIGEATSPAGQPSVLYWVYAGPSLRLPHQQFIAAVFDWFNGTGGINNRKFLGAGGFLGGGGTNGVATQFKGTIDSPAVNEWTFGVGSAVGSRGFVRADFQSRKWVDFYETILDRSTGSVFDPLVGTDVDLSYIVNGNDGLHRTYRAVVLQGEYHPLTRLTLAGNYTWSKLRGNVTQETRNAGPITDIGLDFYPEFFNYANRAPVGYLPADQRHKLRAWASYDQPTFLGKINVSILERFDSGLPYSAVTNIDPIAGGAPSPAYYLGAVARSSSGVPYYFSERGQFRFDSLTATDIGVNYTSPTRLGFFAQAEVENVFNEHAQVLGNTTINVLQAFNPFTTTPIECPQSADADACAAMGADWQKGSNFGKATTPTHYQRPRTYRFSVGLRF